MPLRASAVPPDACEGTRRASPALPLSSGGFFGRPTAVTASDVDVRTYRRLAPPVLAPAEPPSPSDAGLAWLSGLYIGVYGPHGYELLHVRWQAQEAGEAALPSYLAGPGLLLATKVTGDPNVPCGQLTFAARASPPDAAFADDRPAYTVEVLGRRQVEGRAVVLGVRRRAATCELRAAMQINVEPGTWAPSWLPASVLVYGPGGAAEAAGAPPDTVFSVLTDMEEGGRAVYLTDYRRVKRGMLGLADEALLEL